MEGWGRPVGRYDLNKESGLFYHESEQPSQARYSMSEITGSPLEVIGLQVRDTQSGRIWDNIPNAADVSIEYYSPGRFVWQRGVTEKTFNNPRVNPSQVMTEVQVLPSDQHGEIIRPYTATVNLTANGAQLWVRGNDPSQFEFRDVTIEMRAQGMILDLQAQGFRLATYDEALKRAAISELFDHHRTELQRLYLMQDKVFPGEAAKTMSGVAAAVVEMAATTTDPFLFRVVNTAQEFPG